MTDATIIYSHNRAHQNYRDLSHGATGAFPRDRRIIDDFSDTQAVPHSHGRQRYSMMTRGLMLPAMVLVFGGFVAFLASAFLWESFSASIAAMTTLLGLFLFRLGMGQMERDRKIAH